MTHGREDPRAFDLRRTIEAMTRELDRLEQQNERFAGTLRAIARHPDRAARLAAWALKPPDRSNGRH